MSEKKIKYDETYKRLFSNPKLVEESRMPSSKIFRSGFVL